MAAGNGKAPERKNSPTAITPAAAKAWCNRLSRTVPFKWEPNATWRVLVRQAIRWTPDRGAGQNERLGRPRWF